MNHFTAVFVCSSTPSLQFPVLLFELMCFACSASGCDIYCCNKAESLADIRFLLRFLRFLFCTESFVHCALPLLFSANEAQKKCALFRGIINRINYVHA